MRHVKRPIIEEQGASHVVQMIDNHEVNVFAYLHKVGTRINIIKIVASFKYFKTHKYFEAHIIPCPF